MTRIIRSLATYVTLAIGIAGILVLLLAWNMPPFATSTQRTDDAYVQGQVTQISPQLSGIITDVPVTDFEHVKKGDLLVQVDDRIYRQQLDEAKANLAAAQSALEGNDQAQASAQAQIESAKAGVESARATLANAQSQWDRTKLLISKQITSQSNADTVKATLDQARAALDQANASVAVAEQSLATAKQNRESLKAQVSSAQAARELAEINLGNTHITAPRDGMLGQVKAHVGQYVSPGSQIVSLVPDNIWVVANYKETQLPGMKVGQRVKFTVDALNGERFTGRIESFSPATGSEFSVIKADNATGNFTKVAQRVPVKIAIDNGQADEDKLIPGLSVVTAIDTKQN